MKFIQIKAFIILYAFTIFLTACRPVTQVPFAEVTTEPNITSISPSPIPSVTPIQTNTPIATRTFYPTATPSLTPTVTWTPLPTLSARQAQVQINELLKSNGGCNFPCWWGISPGDPIEKVYALNPTIGKSPRLYGSSLYSYTISLDDLNASDLYVEFSVDANQIVQRMEISLEAPSRFRDFYEAFEERLSLAGILGHYGKPSEVLFLVTPRFEPGETPRPYTLFLIYEIQNFGIVYSGLVDSENPLRVCSIMIDDYHLQSIMLYLRDPQSKIAELNRFNSTVLQPLEQVTLMSLDDFYQTFSEPGNNQCIEVSIDAWQ